MTAFEPTLAAAQARLASVDPAAYARTRNALDGAVTRLSPYLTHGVLSLRDVYAAVHARHPMDPGHKFVFELGWRAYWRHVWSHLGDGIHQSLHAGVLPDASYQPAMPADVLEARTGIPAMDLAVRTLYTTGYLHNHARMWLASYLVHLRQVHWHTGAQWMLGHLLDGDIASNQLSWQWVAGTGSSKPYLFNAENVARYAPQEWHSWGTLLDASYEKLEVIARSGTASRAAAANPSDTDQAMEPPPLRASPTAAGWSDAVRGLTTGRNVWLLHPWSTRNTVGTLAPNTVLLGVGLQEAHQKHPWSARRWTFVTEALQEQTPHLWWTDIPSLSHALRDARSVTWQANPHIDAYFSMLRPTTSWPTQEPALFSNVDTYCSSFSQWWARTHLQI